MRRSRRVTDCGALGRENVGLSNRIAGESPAHRKSKVSLAMVFNQGLGDPKANPKGVADGQLVNIPTLVCISKSRRSAVISADNWISRSCTHEQSRCEKIWFLKPEIGVSALPRKKLLG